MSAVTYNPHFPKGPNPMVTDPNKQYTDMGSNVYIMVASGCVWPIIPGIGLLYAGLSRKQSAMSLLFKNFVVWGVVSIIWFLFGYSLVASVTGGPMIGNFVMGGLKDVEASVSPGAAAVSEPIYMVFEMYFCVCTVCIMIGGGSERARIIPLAIFSCIWSVLVYDFAAYWTWSPNGWLYALGTLDFAGGSPVHIASGFGALAYSIVLGKRRDPSLLENGSRRAVVHSKPHNPILVFIGTLLICFGWLFFNSGTSLGDNTRTAYAFANTALAAPAAVISFSILHYLRNGYKWSVVAACEGAIAGLVGITPAAGFVPLHFAVVTGLVTGIFCQLTDGLTRLVGIDEGLEVFNLHGLGGICGGVCTALFAADWVAALDGVTQIKGGWINSHWKQLGYNLAGCVSIAAWSFVMTVCILVLMNLVPWLRLRVTEEEELQGYDSAIMDESLIMATFETIMAEAQTANIDLSQSGKKSIQSTTNDEV